MPVLSSLSMAAAAANGDSNITIHNREVAMLGVLVNPRIGAAEHAVRFHPRYGVSRVIIYGMKLSNDKPFVGHEGDRFARTSG